jgi:hypothetical protein
VQINIGAPVAGANSFTESQPKSRMKAAGHTTVTRLAGAPMDVTLDYQGNAA